MKRAWGILTLILALTAAAAWAVPVRGGGRPGARPSSPPAGPLYDPVRGSTLERRRAVLEGGHRGNPSGLGTFFGISAAPRMPSAGGKWLEASRLAVEMRIARGGFPIDYSRISGLQMRYMHLQRGIYDWNLGTP